MKTILVADDEPHITRVLKLLLQKSGYSVEVVPNGQVALEYLRVQHPDVLITDIQMPRMTGQQLCNKIQEEFPDRHFLIFVLTSRTEIEHREWTENLDNVRFLEKPVSTRKLISMLDEYFELRKGA